MSLTGLSYNDPWLVESTFFKAMGTRQTTTTTTPQLLPNKFCKFIDLHMGASSYVVNYVNHGIYFHKMGTIPANIKSMQTIKPIFPVL